MSHPPETERTIWADHDLIRNFSVDIRKHKMASYTYWTRDL